MSKHTIDNGFKDASIESDDELKLSTLLLPALGRLLDLGVALDHAQHAIALVPATSQSSRTMTESQSKIQEKIRQTIPRDCSNDD